MTIIYRLGIRWIDRDSIFYHEPHEQKMKVTLPAQKGLFFFKKIRILLL